MRVSGFTHVSIHATDVEELASFYEELLDIEREPAPKFGIPVVWLRLGDQQLHLFERDIDAPTYHHFGVEVDDFSEFYRRARELDVLLDEDDPQGSDIYELPDGSVQAYFRDPEGNLAEVDYPDVTDLDEEIRAKIVKREDQFTQSAENRRATLFPSQ
jgi:catechol 2,3-dioxygenase-like lactoylglutathione lyase family enzyme